MFYLIRVTFDGILQDRRLGSIDLKSTLPRWTVSDRKNKERAWSSDALHRGSDQVARSLPTEAGAIERRLEWPMR